MRSQYRRFRIKTVEGIDDYKMMREVVRRHEQHLHALHHKSFDVSGVAGARVRVTLDIVPDEDDPHALLAATDADGAQMAEWRVAAGYKLDAASARDWVEGGCEKPR